MGAKLPLIGKSDAFIRPTTEKKKTELFHRGSYIRSSSKEQEKRSLDLSKTTIKSTVTSNKKGLPPNLKNISSQKKAPKEPLEVNLQVDKIKCLYMSIDGGVMTSTIVNVDLE